MLTDDAYSNKKRVDESIFILNSIVSDIKQKVPFDAILTSENIKTPLTGEVCLVINKYKEITLIFLKITTYIFFLEFRL